MTDQAAHTWAFPALNYTQTPNAYYDDMMRVLSPAGFKIVGVLIRQTFGWHRSEAECSLTFFEAATGMTRPTVISGIKDGMEQGVIKRLKKAPDGGLVLYGGEPELDELEDVTGPNGGFLYRLVVEDDQNPGQLLVPGPAGKNSLPVPGSKNSLPPTGSKNSLPANPDRGSNSFTSDGKESLPKERKGKKNSLKKDSVPSDDGTQSFEDQEQEKQQEKARQEAILHAQMQPILDEWKRLFPKKRQPKISTHSEKLKVRLKEPGFCENWRAALLAASESATLQRDSWFQFEFFVRNDLNWQRLLNREWQWKDDQLAAQMARAAGRPQEVNPGSSVNLTNRAAEIMKRYGSRVGQVTQ